MKKPVDAELSDNQIEEQLRVEFNDAAPDIIDDLIAEIDAREAGKQSDAENQAGKPGEQSEKKVRERDVILYETDYRRRWLRYAGAIAAALLIFTAVGVLFGKSAEDKKAPDPVAMVGLDVNPSVEMYIDDTHHVIECRAVNDDGRKIIGDMDMKGADIKVAANALVGSMLTHGYLTDTNNSIFLSVVADDSAKGRALEDELTSDLNGYFENATVSAAVLGQYIEEDDEIKSFAETNSISTGKAWLIKALCAGNSRMTEKSLLKLSTQELLLIWSENDSAQDENTVKYGKVNSGGNISSSKACNIALKDAGAAKDSVQNLTSEYECDDGRLIYEISFVFNSSEYEYDIDAKSGTIIESESESSKSYSSSGNGSNGAAKRRNDDDDDSDDDRDDDDDDDRDDDRDDDDDDDD